MRKKQISELLEIPLSLPGWNTIALWEIATLERVFKDKTITYGWEAWSADNYAVGITIFKANRTNVFSTAKSAKQYIEDTLQKPLFNESNLHIQMIWVILLLMIINSWVLIDCKQ